MAALQSHHSNRERQSNEAARAAKWMQEEMMRNSGVLTQVQAWQGVRQHFGAQHAPRNSADSWLSRFVLSAFRKLTPDVIWDPTGKRWRAHRRSDAVRDGSRMLNPKASA